MLLQLDIENFIIVDKLSLNFESGFTAITGETGAGKSILIDAISMTLGDKAETSMVRENKEKATISAIFDISNLPNVQQYLIENDLNDSDSNNKQLIIRRIIFSNSSSKSKAYINANLTTISQLKTLGEMLVDIHGQHAHQSLLKNDLQRRLFDSHSELDDLVNNVSNSYKNWYKAKIELENAEQNSLYIEQEKQTITWQLNDLKELGDFVEVNNKNNKNNKNNENNEKNNSNISAWQSLENEQIKLSHSQNLLDTSQFVLHLLSNENDDSNCENLIHQAVNNISNLLEYDSDLNEVNNLLLSIQNELTESIAMLRHYCDNIELDPNRLNDLNNQIEKLLTVSRKYKLQSPEQLPAYYENLQNRYEQLNQSLDIQTLKNNVEKHLLDYENKAKILTQKRQQSAQKMSVEVSKIMQKLALVDGKFIVNLIPKSQPTTHGNEDIEFCISGLAGQEFRPLNKVVSGGELSRISLAIQVLTAQNAYVPTLIFDEVDVGIGGSVAEIVGNLLSELANSNKNSNKNSNSKNCQILCITHLAQVAAKADNQWQVSKSKNNKTNETISQIIKLDSKQQRIEEIARMIGGIDITDITLQHAKELLENK